MGCNCKNIKNFEDRYGIPEEETILGKILRYIMKFILLVIALVLVVILTPIIMVWTIYAMFFNKNRIVLPKFLRKYLTEVHGKKL